MDTVTLSAAAVGAASLLKDTTSLLAEKGASAGHHSCSKKSGPVDMHLISHQISELAHRVDTLESSMKSDIRTILEILQQQHQQPTTAHRPAFRISPQQQQQQQPPQQAAPHLTTADRQMTNTYQTDSEYSSFDLGLCVPEKVLQHQSSTGSSHGGPAIRLTPTQQKQHKAAHTQGGNVQRSISQPECANERNLFR